MTQVTKPPGSPRSIAVHLSGDRHDALLLALSENGARLQLMERHTLWIGRSIALSILDLPALIGNIREIDREKIGVEFRNKLDPSVVKFIHDGTGIPAAPPPSFP
ncbi:hypothetical protein [Pontixanthobacter aquaemixtae]|uniref:PilZ domain-containing protein n=1 Tax=Pontixanthobacter aquaemixtae TaxID=1958940 RepID=A0A844ZTG5_9SPHN|nr:hypothetical protein [Pontixanthobacter aquaemixtae]MXO90754.1 hypothetical protein [Pontixanthobacter aquaemixtae]